MELGRADKARGREGDWERAAPEGRVQERDRLQAMAWPRGVLAGLVAGAMVLAAGAGAAGVVSDADVEGLGLDEQEKGELVMPGGDGTGPMGMGAMTGRGLGPCSGNGVPAYGYRGWRGGGWGRGMWGRGWRNMFRASGLFGWQRWVPGRQYGEGVESLKQQEEYLESALNDVRRQIKESDAS